MSAVARASAQPASVTRLMVWDLSTIFQYLVERKRWSRRRCEKVCQEYRRFLALCLMYPEARLSPPEDVDEMWHTHILFTKAYRAFCDDTKGEYIDHTPFLKADRDPVDSRRASKTVLTLYRRHFGEPNHSIWPLADSVGAMAVDCSASCGDCSSSDCATGPDRCS